MKKSRHYLATALLVGAAFTTFLAGCSTDSASLPDQPDLTGVPSTSFTASGATTLNATVASFQNALGNPNNGAGAAAAGGRREINWDGVPAGLTNVNGFPGDFFSVNSTRGALLSTNGPTFRVADDNFVSVNPAYAGQFNTFSSPKSFAAVGSNVMDVQFNVVGSNSPAGVKGFGAVFSDVDVAGSTKLEFFNNEGDLVATVVAPVRSDAGGLSFAGAILNNGQLATRVRVTLGNSVLSNVTVEAGGTDLVVADDFLYAEPQAVPFRVVKASGDISAAVAAHRIALGNPNNAATASQVSGRREVNWDAVPGNLTNVNTFPGNFFAVNSTRGLVMGTPGTGFRVSDILFSDVNPSYNALFRTFSAPRLFSAVGSNEINCTFQQAASAVSASVRGFGCVFSDVDLPSTSGLRFISGNGAVAKIAHAPVRSDSVGLSFVGVDFPVGISFPTVKVVSGTGAIGAGVQDVKNSGAVDCVVVDDFLYTEPR